MPQHAVGGTPSKVSFLCIWRGTPTSELLFYKARLVKCQCSLATRAWHTSLRILQSAIILMPGYIGCVKRFLKVLHSSCTKIFKLGLEISNSIPKPLQWIGGHSKDVALGFRLWSHHYPSNYLLPLCFSSLFFDVFENSFQREIAKKNEIVLFLRSV